MYKTQQEAFDKFTQLKVGALFMKMGTGKTRVATMLVDYNNCDLAVFVAPKSTLSNIEKELIKWKMKTKYILIGYETIQASDRKYLELLRELENKKCFLVADESIFIKNEDTKRFNRVCQIRDKCEYALILNGTPIVNNEWDLYNQMFLLSPKILNMNRPQFLNTFFKHIIYKKRGKNKHDFYKFSEVNAELLKKLIEPYIFYADLEFDKKETTNIIWCDYTGNDYYLEKEKRLKQYQENGEAQEIINMLTCLNVISANNKIKNDKLCEYIKDKQVIVYCDFLKEIEYISSKIDCFVITGKGSYSARDSILEQFKNSKKPLLMTYGVGSYSLNLQFCNEIVLSSINFDFGKVEQCKYRIKRMGQERDITYTYFLSNLGINRLILDNLQRKDNLKNIISNKIKKGDLEWIKSL